jgi:hypothetical protein
MDSTPTTTFNGDKEEVKNEVISYSYYNTIIRVLKEAESELLNRKVGDYGHNFKKSKKWWTSKMQYPKWSTELQSIKNEI